MTRGGKLVTTCRLDLRAEEESASYKLAATLETAGLFSEAFERHNDHWRRPHEDME